MTAYKKSPSFRGLIESLNQTESWQLCQLLYHDMEGFPWKMHCGKYSKGCLLSKQQEIPSPNL